MRYISKKFSFEIHKKWGMKKVSCTKTDGALRGVPAEGVADKQQSVATCLGARGKPSPLNIKFCVLEENLHSRLHLGRQKDFFVVQYFKPLGRRK